MPRAHNEMNSREKSHANHPHDRQTRDDDWPADMVEKLSSQPVAPLDADARSRVGAFIGRAALNLRAR